MTDQMPVRIPTVFHCVPNMAGGGAERQLCMLARALHESGTKVHVACVPTGLNYARLWETGAIVHALTARSSYDPGLLLQLVRLMRATRPDVVQTWLPQMDVLGGMAARLCGIPFILSERSSARAYPTSPRTIVRNTIARLATAVAANSNAGRDYWQPRVTCPIRVIRNGVYQGGALLHKDCFPTILFLGRFHHDKCAIETALGVAEALRQCASARAIFQGSGPDEAELRRIAQTSDLGGRMTLLPFAADARQTIARAAVFVSVSRYEGQPNAVIEAAMSDIPLVLSDIPAHREMFGDADCTYVADWSPTAISDAVMKVLRMPQEAARRAAAAKSIVSAFSVDAMATAYLDLYTSVTTVASR